MRKGAQARAKSSIAALALAIVSAGSAAAHEVRPAVGDITVSATEVRLELQVTLESLVSGINLDQITDTNDSPLSGLYDRLRALPPDALQSAFRDTWPGLQDGFVLQVDGQAILPEIEDIRVPPVGDVETARDSVLVLRADLPAGDSPVVAGWIAPYGPLVLRQAGEGEEMYSGYLTSGALSDPLPRDGIAQVTAGTVFARYVVLGFEHIIPKGLDHILFVMALFMFSRHLRPLLIQVSAFTVAHTVTLALASLDIVSVSPSIVEPLIALSIVYAAVENLWGGSIGWHRTALIFAFGLLHGLGFAGVLGEIGLDQSQFVLSLVAFNIGVELGQLAVIAFMLVWIWATLLASRAAPRAEVLTRAMVFRAISVAGSIVIALTGSWWVIERTVL